MLVWNCLSVCLTDTTLEIIKHPCNVDISITDRSRTVTFQCTVNRIDARYHWEMENQTITNRALGVNSSLLVIPNLAVSDAGRYRCTVSDGTRNISSSFAQLTISGESKKGCAIIMIYMWYHDYCLESITINRLIGDLDRRYRVSYDVVQQIKRYYYYKC